MSGYGDLACTDDDVFLWRVVLVSRLNVAVGRNRKRWRKERDASVVWEHEMPEYRYRIAGKDDEILIYVVLLMGRNDEVFRNDGAADVF